MHILKNSILLIAIFLFIHSNSHAQNHQVLSDPERPWLYYSSLENIFYKTMAHGILEGLAQREAEIAKIDSREKVEARIRYVKRQFQEAVGEFPEKTPLNPQITDVLERDFYTVEKLLYASRPNFRVSAAVFKPKGFEGQRLPAVLYLSGHTNLAFRSNTYQKVILNLVKKGFLVMAIDPIGQAERNEPIDRKLGINYSDNTTQHTYIGSQCLLAGSSLIQYMIWDGIRAVDYLVSRPDVDPDNIGATGRSGGGTQTAWLGVFEPRLKATAIENYLTTFRRLVQSIGYQDGEQNVTRGIARGLDFADLLLVRAPKPTLVIATDADFFNIQGAKECYQEAKNMYRLLGQEDQVAFQTDVAKHSSTHANRMKLYEFFLSHLSTPKEFKDEEITLLPVDSLQVLPKEDKHLLFEETVTKINKRAYLETKKQLSAKPQVLDSAYLQQVLGIQWNQGTSIKTSEVLAEDYAVEKYFIESGSYPLPFIVVKPKTPNGKVLSYYSPKGKAVFADSTLRDLTQRGFTLVLSDMLGIGELGTGNYGGSSTRVNPGGLPPSIWFMGNQTTRSVLGIWVADMKRMQEFVAERFPEYESYIWAEDYLSVAALHLSRFTAQYEAMGLEGMLYAWESLITHKFYDPKWLPTTVAGISFKYDLPDLIESGDREKVKLYNLVSEMSLPLDTQALNMPEFQNLSWEETSDALFLFLGIEK